MPNFGRGSICNTQNGDEGSRKALCHIEEKEQTFNG